jgi:hypothetical protein
MGRSPPDNNWRRNAELVYTQSSQTYEINNKREKSEPNHNKKNRR